MEDFLIRPLATDSESHATIDQMPRGQFNASATAPAGPAALVIAHPGHELRIHGWLELMRPRVFVLTDGSGRSHQSRLGSTTRILAETGASSGRIYGRMTDLEVYTALLNHKIDLFVELAQELAEALIIEQVESVVGDAAEGYNPTHDVCRLIANAAVAIVSQKRGRKIANFDFLLVGPPDNCPEAIRAQAIRLELSEDTFERKMKVARAYPELESEVNVALSKNQAEAFRVECLRPVDARVESSDWSDAPPFYELYGEKQVAVGYYSQVIRYREHILPLAEELKRLVERNT